MTKSGKVPCGKVPCEKVPCEKVIELLFTRHALNMCGANTVLYAPSSREEYLKGYDTSLLGPQGSRELLLQFKTPNICSDGLHTVSIKPHQHLRLRHYDPGSAFYVSHIFSSYQQLQNGQLQYPNPENFLKHYIAVDASALPSDTNFFQFSPEGASLPERTPFSKAPRFKRKQDGRKRKGIHLVSVNAWTDGFSILQQFQQGSMGQVLNPSRIPFLESDTQAWQDAEELYSTGFERWKSEMPIEPGTDYGVLLRSDINAPASAASF
jgi:hypothetical protein